MPNTAPALPTIKLPDLCRHVLAESALVPPLSLGTSPPSFTYAQSASTAPRAFTASLSSTCPSLQCGLYNTCCRVRFAGIVPPTLVYTDGWGLPINYDARALSTLPHLHTVRVALPYSPRGTHISLDPTAPPDLNAELWVGECERYPAFRARYMARKNGVLLPKLTPAKAGAERSRLYRDPPALERGWDEDEGDASEYAASDYGEEEEYVEREMGIESEREQEGHPGGNEQQHLEHASGDEEAA
ncbi:hypothetical protein B0H14DRAFT_3493085 [Mycena olivaceomarginata]|nr:hypothetical protein B0H14DRAFT_3493085 [Mycena olivaceomarginata]